MPSDTPRTPHPTPPDEAKIERHDGPAGGWGSVKGMAEAIGHEHDVPIDQLMRQNKADGFMCFRCAWSIGRRLHVRQLRMVQAGQAASGRIL
jgi:hypothetical protein